MQTFIFYAKREKSTFSGFRKNKKKRYTLCCPDVKTTLNPVSGFMEHVTDLMLKRIFHFLLLDLRKKSN